jgi:hypothetical protein
VSLTPDPGWLQNTHGLIAQSLGEYGAISVVSGALADLFDAASDTLRNVDNKTWAIVAVAAFVVWFLFLRRR